MANKLKGEVAFTAFDKQWTLVMDFNTLCSVDIELGIGIRELGERMKASPALIRSVFRIALEQNHGTLTDLEAGRIIVEIGPQRAGDLIAEAVQAGFPEAAQGGAGDPPRAPAAKPARKRPGTTPRR